MGFGNSQRRQNAVGDFTVCADLHKVTLRSSHISRCCRSRIGDLRKRECRDILRRKKFGFGNQSLFVDRYFCVRSCACACVFQHKRNARIRTPIKGCRPRPVADDTDTSCCFQFLCDESLRHNDEFLGVRDPFPFASALCFCNQDIQRFVGLVQPKLSQVEVFIPCRRICGSDDNIVFQIFQTVPLCRAVTDLHLPGIDFDTDFALQKDGVHRRPICRCIVPALDLTVKNSVTHIMRSLHL